MATINYVKDINIRAWDGSGNAPINIDKSTRAQTTIDYSHHEIHAGSSFYFMNVVSGVASGTIMNMLLTTPNTAKWAHFLPRVSTNKKIHAYFYENPTVTSTAGTQMTTINRNRNSTNSASVGIWGGASATSQGATLLLQRTFGATGVAGGDVGGAARAVNEIILKQGEDYLFRLEVLDADASITAELNWYEHTDK